MTAVQRHLRSDRPLWLEHAGHRRRYPSLSGPHQASVAIVGGGMTGALIAHAFASAGISTILIEASEFGRGSTAASSALLLQEPDLELTELANRYGKRTANRIWQMSRESVHALVYLLARLRIGCDLKQRDAIYYAIDGQAVARLRAEYEMRLRSGFDARWLTAGALRRSTGIVGRGAIRTHGSAQFDPTARVSACCARPRRRARSCSNGRRSGGSSLIATASACGPIREPLSASESWSRPDMRPLDSDLSQVDFGCIAPTCWRLVELASQSAVRWACPMSCCGTPSVPITIRGGRKTID